MSVNNLTITGITARPVLVPFRRPVRTASFVIPSVPLVLIDVHTSEGVTGRAYVLAFADWVFRPLVASFEAAESMIVGQPAAPSTVQALLRQKMLLVGTAGMTSLVVGGIDMALWDATSKVHDVPLATMLGGQPGRIRAYNSCGLWMQSLDTLADEASELVEEGGFHGIKLRIGRADAREDLDAVRIVRERIGDRCALMTDYNQSLRTGDAIERGRMLDDEGLAWIEDPVAFDNFEGHARIRAALNTPIQTGENFYDPRRMQRAIAMEALDYAMPDAALIGGVTGMMQAAAIADVNDIPMSTHLYPEYSRHILSVTPTVHWLEYVDWASPVLQEPVQVVDSHVTTPQAPGAGIAWDEDAVAQYLV